MTEDAMPAGSRALHQRIGFLVGPLVAALMLALPAPEGLADPAWRTAAVALLMAVWWVTEAIPIPATSLIPLVALPLLGIADTAAAAAPYADPIIFLLFGGFIVALGLEKWMLHKRLALAVLVRLGGRPDRIVAGFMIATALVSMWVSNAAATMMMIPIATSVIAVLALDGKESRPFAAALVLGVAYAASIGGLGTLVGTPPNAMLAGFMARTYGIEVGFGEWAMIGVPVVVAMIPLTWLVLTRFAFNLGRLKEHDGSAAIAAERAQLGPMSRPEKRAATIFALTALAWCFRPEIASLPGLGALTDSTVAVLGALALFVTPSGDRGGRGRFLMDWRTANRLNWGVLLLFGGGLSLAGAVASSGLASWLGEALAPLTRAHPFVLVAAVVTLVIFLTELTSNTATTAAMLPVLGAIASKGGIDPLLLAAPAVLAVTCAFMLPVGTAPNAIVFGSGHVTIPEMAKAGFRVNLVGIVIITAAGYWLAPLVFGGR